MKVVTYDDIQNINRLYLELKTYAAVARATGFSPSTVKKYIINDFVPQEEIKYVRFDQPLPEFNPSIFRTQDWGPLCELTEEEITEIEGLWKELIV